MRNYLVGYEQDGKLKSAYVSGSLQDWCRNYVPRNIKLIEVKRVSVAEMTKKSNVKPDKLIMAW